MYKFSKKILLILTVALLPALTNAATLQRISATSLYLSGTGVILSATGPTQTASITNIYAKAISATTLNVGGGGLSGVNVSSSQGGYVSATNVHGQNISGTSGVFVSLDGPTVARAYGYVDGSGNLQSNSYNTASTALVSIGVFDVSFTNPMSSTNYAVNVTSEAGGGCNQTAYINSKNTGGFRMTQMFICGTGSSFNSIPFSYVVYENR